MHVLAQVEQAVCVRFRGSDRLGAAKPARGVADTRLGRRVAPRIPALLEAAAGGEFPFGLGRQAQPNAPMSIWRTSVFPPPPTLKEQVMVRTITSPKRISEIRSIGSRKRLTGLEDPSGTRYAAL